MMRPPPPLRMCGTQARQHSATPRMFTSITLRHSATSISSKGLQLDRAEDRGVVDQDVDAAEGFDGFRRHAFDFFFIADVDLEPEGLRAGRFGDLGRRHIEFPHIGDHHRGAVGRETAGERLADAAAGAGDDGDLAFQPVHTTCSYVHRPGEQAHVLGEAVHRLHGLRGDRGIVERRVAADELGDQARLGGRKELLADCGRALRAPPSAHSAPPSPR